MDWVDMKANWAAYREQVLERWDELTDDQLEEIRGERAILLTKLQEAYGIDKQEAEAQVQDFEEAH
jgi:uncharacterized protein YjbJ (UPF0337 family)